MSVGLRELASICSAEPRELRLQLLERWKREHIAELVVERMVDVRSPLVLTDAQRFMAKVLTATVNSMRTELAKALIVENWTNETEEPYVFRTGARVVVVKP